MIEEGKLSDTIEKTLDVMVFQTGLTKRQLKKELKEITHEDCLKEYSESDRLSYAAKALWVARIGYRRKFRGGRK